MQIVWNLVLAVQIVSAIAMIGLVLVQHGKGADMGASFGSGASGSLFGASGSANFLSRMTSACATVFFACTLALAYFGHAAATRPESTSVFERAGAAAASVPAASAPAPLAQIPTAPAPAASPAQAASEAPSAPQKP